MLEANKQWPKPYLDVLDELYQRDFLVYQVKKHRWDSFSNKQPLCLFSSLEYLGCWRLISNDQNHILTSWMNYYTHEGVVRQLCYSCACMNFNTRFIKPIKNKLSKHQTIFCWRIDIHKNWTEFKSIRLLPWRPSICKKLFFFSWNSYLKTDSISLRYLISIKDPKQNSIKMLITKGQLIKGNLQ